jgi:Na+/proline symporter
MFQFTLFLLIGTILFVYYRDNGLAAPAQPDRIYPAFIWNSLPPGISGLVIAAILAAAMSNLSAALNSLASTTIMDFYKPLVSRATTAADEARFLRLARLSTVFWGVVLFVIAWISQGVRSVLEAGLSIASVLYGALLGVFLLGVLTTRVGERAAMAGMIAGMITMLFVKTGTTIAWTWYVMIGTGVTFAAGFVASQLLNEVKQGAD